MPFLYIVILLSPIQLISSPSDSISVMKKPLFPALLRFHHPHHLTLRIYFSNQLIPTATKIEFINRLSRAGLKSVEATSFVSPKWVPQMADHVEVVRGLDHNGVTVFPVLTPNLKGYEAAVRVYMCLCVCVCVLLCVLSSSEKKISPSFRPSSKRVQRRWPYLALHPRPSASE